MRGEAPDEANARAKRRLSGASRFWLGFTALLAVLAVVTVIFPAALPPAPRTEVGTFDLQGHRGARGLMSENSLPAFEQALALGVTTLELDTVLTADGVLMVHHDRRLVPDRTRDASGAWIAGVDPPAFLALTSDDLKAYDIGRARPGSRTAKNFPDQTGFDGVAIPTLAAVLARTETLSGGNVRYNIETKISPLSPEDSADPSVFAEALIAAIRKAGVESRAAVQSFDWRTLQLVQQAAPEIVTAYLTAEQSWLDNLGRGAAAPSPWIGDLEIDWAEMSLPQAIHRAGGAIWSPYYRDLREADLREAQALGLHVVPWTVNDPADMASLIDLGVDGLITDYPDRARRVMAEEGLPLPPSFPGK
ncbi:MAG: glycerophosphodiester phosphodiesterase [Kiloniellaceae bacterium]